MTAAIEFDRLMRLVNDRAAAAFDAGQALSGSKAAYRQARDAEHVADEKLRLALRDLVNRANGGAS